MLRITNNLDHVFDLDYLKGSGFAWIQNEAKLEEFAHDSSHLWFFASGKTSKDFAQFLWRYLLDNIDPAEYNYPESPNSIESVLNSYSGRWKIIVSNPSQSSGVYPLSFPLKLPSNVVLIVCRSVNLINIEADNIVVVV
jgi:hypothetical protein